MARWIIGSNMPGYMPDSDPFTTDSYRDAVFAFICDLETLRDDIDTEGGPDAGDDMSVIDGAMNKLYDLAKTEAEKEVHVYVNGWHYWLERNIEFDL